jgi:hypothetical protein
VKYGVYEKMCGTNQEHKQITHGYEEQKAKR